MYGCASHLHVLFLNDQNMQVQLFISLFQQQLKISFSIILKNFQNPFTNDIYTIVYLKQPVW